MVFRIRYQLRGEWTCVDVNRLDGEHADRFRGRILFRTAEWTLLYARLGQRSPMACAGMFEIGNHDEGEKTQPEI